MNYSYFTQYRISTNKEMNFRDIKKNNRTRINLMITKWPD